MPVSDTSAMLPTFPLNGAESKDWNATLNLMMSQRNLPRLQQLAQNYRQATGQSLAFYSSRFQQKQEQPFFFSALMLSWDDGVLWCLQDLQEHQESLGTLRHPWGADAMMFLVGRLGSPRQSFYQTLYPEVLRWIQQGYPVYTFCSGEERYIQSAANNALSGDHVELFDALLWNYTQEQFEYESPQWALICGAMEDGVASQVKTCIERHRVRLEQHHLEQALDSTSMDALRPRLRF